MTEDRDTRQMLQEARPTPEQRGTSSRYGGRSPATQTEPEFQQQVPISVWAYHSDVAVSWWAGNGWNLVLPSSFTNLSGLIGLLRSSGATGRIRHLGIVAHGGTARTPVLGEISVSPPLRAASLSHPSIQNFFRDLSLFLIPQGKLTFFSCIAGGGVEGTNLLIGISNLLPGRTITGFITYGLVGQGHNVAGNITDTLISSLPGRSLRGYPRLSDTSPSAKKALNGSILQWPRYAEMWNQLARVDAAFQRQITERWIEARGRTVTVPAEDQRRYQMEQWQQVSPLPRRQVPATSATDEFQYYVQRYLDGGM